MMRIEVVTRTNQIGFARSKNDCVPAKLALLVQKNMATLKQIDANRRNALRSTGPRTPEGKAVLPNESPADFTELCESRTEQFYLEQMAVSQWKLSRMPARNVSSSASKTPGPISLHRPRPPSWTRQHLR